MTRFLSTDIRRRIFLAALLLTVGPAVAGGQEEIPTEVEIPQITVGQIPKIPVLVRDFKYDGVRRSLLTTGEACETILVQDLNFSDYLEVQREGTAGWGEERKSPDAVVFSEVVSRFGKVVLRGQLIDSGSGEIIFEDTYDIGDPPDRWALHSFSDDIVLYLTGERGVARTRIAFVGDATGSKEIYLIDYDGARLERFTSLSSITVSPDWAPNGKELAFTTFAGGNPDLVKKRVGESDVMAISNRPGVNLAPAYDPNGSRLAASLSFEGNSEIYLVGTDGSNLRRLTVSENSIETSPSFSPDGSELVYVSDRTGQTQLYIMSADGANSRRISFLDGMCDSPDWSPDGEWIAFVARIDSGFDIFLIKPDGSGLARVTKRDGNHENPTWAPDSRHLVYAKRVAGSRRLFVSAFDGSGKRQLTWSSGDQYNPSWSPPLSE